MTTCVWSKILNIDEQGEFDAELNLDLDIVQGVIWIVELLLERFCITACRIVGSDQQVVGLMRYLPKS